MTIASISTLPEIDELEAFGARLARIAGQDPDGLAIVCGTQTLTWDELDRRTNRLARRYAELGVRPDDMVSIALPNGIAFFEAVLASAKLGAVPQPLSHRMPAPERAAIVELAASALIISETDPPTPGDDDPDLDAPLEPRIAASWKAPTSGGSTGRPKLIVSTQPAAAQVLDAVGELMAIEPSGMHLATAPLYHNGPFMAALISLLRGKGVVVMPRFDARDALALIERHRVDWVYLVPTMMHRIWRLPERERNAFDLSSLRHVMHMAAPCPAWLKRAWIDWLGADRVLELYAGAEAQAATIISGSEWLQRPGSVGRPAIGEIAVFDEAGRPVPTGTIGEVWMRPPAGARATYRYIGAAARTHEDGWESLGDMGHQDEDGYLYLADRRSDMVVVGGCNVYPAEVEAALDEHPAVESSCVIGLPDEDLGRTARDRPGARAARRGRPASTPGAAAGSLQATS